MQRLTVNSNISDACIYDSVDDYVVFYFLKPKVKFKIFKIIKIKN